MLYPALPPAPSVIPIVLQSNQVVEQRLIEKQPVSEQPQNTAESTSENGDNATAAKAQGLDSSLEQIQSDYASDRLELATRHYDVLADSFPATQAFTPEFSINQATTKSESDTSAEFGISQVTEFTTSQTETIANLPQETNNSTQPAEKSASPSSDTNTKSVNDIKPIDSYGGVSTSENRDSRNLVQNIKSVGGTFLVGVIINEREVGSLEIRLDGDTILIPLDAFAELASLQLEKLDNNTRLKTPLGVIELAASSLKQIDGITYIHETLLKEKLSTQIEFKASDLALIVDLPWRRNSGVSGQSAPELEPEVRPPSSALSSLRQELYLYNNSNDTSLFSSTLLGGRLGGGTWRVRLNNNFENQPNITEYYYYKRAGQFRYQVGRQQIGLHPLVSGINVTGAQIGFTNLPTDRFYQSNSASELLPRRSRPLQTFRGEAPPASFVQLRVGGIIAAQQQVGLNGIYEFVDVNLPAINSNEIELLVFDRNNPSVPIEIRSLRLNASDLLLPAGGNVQLAGLGLSGNLAQDALFNGFNGDAGKLTGFYQFRQGLSDNFTFEGAVQAIPDTLQAQAGFVWRMANPAILATSIGTSHGQLGYTADLNVDFGNLEILGNSQLFPDGYNSNSQSRDRYNHSLETKYRFSDKFSLGFIARSRQDERNSSDYISPTFSLNPFSGFSLRGRPDFAGRYLFSAFYQPTSATKLSFNTFGDIYTSDFSYKFNREYQFSLGGEFGGDLAARYTATINYSSPSFGGLSWRLGLGYSDGEVGPVVGASMQLLPGLFARVDYQGIPSRTRNLFGGYGDDRLTISLVSDLSFAGGSITPSKSYSLGQERGGIAGRIVVEGGNKNFNLDGAIIRVVDSRNKKFGTAKTDSNGNFFVGNLPEGVYIVEIDPDKLPVELSTTKISIVAEVAGSAVTRLDFPVQEEYGVAGRITDAAGQPMAEVKVELISVDGKRVTSGLTDQFGLYRLDGVPVGKYTLQLPSQDSIAEANNLPKRPLEIRNQFVYEQNLQLPISAAAKKK